MGYYKDKTENYLAADDTLAADVEYYIWIDLKSADGYTLAVLTAANAKLDSKAAESVYTWGTSKNSAELVFKLPKLEASHTHTYGTEWKSDADKHWHECSCGAKSEEAAHTLKWVVDKAATATEKGSKHEECEFCGYKRAAVEIPATGNTGSGSGGSGSSGSSSGGGTTPAKKPVQSVGTGDMGIALYAGMTILSLTGGAWVVNKKRKSK